MNKLVKKFLATDKRSWALLVLRLALAVVILPHGMQKALGSFGGYGFEGTMGAFTGMGMPWILAFMVILAEFVAPLLLIIGLGSRFMAFSIFTVMFGAMVIGGHVANGFFMNWYGAQAGEGMEYFIIVLGAALALLLAGGGKFSLDTLIAKKLK